MTRRLLLQGFFVALWSRAAESAHHLSGRLRTEGKPLRRSVNEPAADAPPLSARELGGLLAFAEVVVAGHVLSPVDRGYLTEYIAERVRRIPDQQARYHTTTRLLDQLAGKPFADLEIAGRVETVRRHGLGAGAAPAGQETEPFAADAQMVRLRIVPDLIAGYWTSPAGWTAIGYEIFPGRCGDLTRYTRPEV